MPRAETWRLTDCFYRQKQTPKVKGRKSRQTRQQRSNHGRGVAQANGGALLVSTLIGSKLGKIQGLESAGPHSAKSNRKPQNAMPILPFPLWNRIQRPKRGPWKSRNEICPSLPTDASFCTGLELDREFFGEKLYHHV